MARSYALRRIEIKGTALFTCDRCGRAAEGDSFTQTFSTYEEAVHFTPGPNLMPVGWGSYPGIFDSDYLSFRCPNCK